MFVKLCPSPLETSAKKMNGNNWNFKFENYVEGAKNAQLYLNQT